MKILKTSYVRELGCDAEVDMVKCTNCSNIFSIMETAVHPAYLYCCYCGKRDIDCKPTEEKK